VAPPDAFGQGRDHGIGRRRLSLGTGVGGGRNCTRVVISRPGGHGEVDPGEFSGQREDRRIVGAGGCDLIAEVADEVVASIASELDQPPPLPG